MNRKPKKPFVKEKVVQKHVLQWCAWNRIHAWRTQTLSIPRDNVDKHGNVKRSYIRTGTPGSPDITGCLPDGKYLGIECKGTGKKQSDVQIAFQQEIDKVGGIYILAVGGEGVDTVQKRLIELGYIR